MDGVSFSATTEKRKGILFDPRTKLVLLLTITTLMFSTSNEGIMNIVKPCLSLVPFVLILSEHRFKTAGKYLLLYVACFALERIALVYLSGLLSFIVLAITSIMTRFAPGIMTGAWLISSTSVSEFISAMERMHITEKIVIPMSVIFRFFPTISEEYQAIRDAMKMRNIRFGGKNPFLPHFDYSTSDGEKIFRLRKKSIYCAIGSGEKNRAISSSKIRMICPKNRFGRLPASVCFAPSTTNTRSESCASVESLRRVKEMILCPCCLAWRTSLSTGSVSPLWLTANMIALSSASAR